jgi:branched-chain amino acid transport system substrate-binding protein
MSKIRPIRSGETRRNLRIQKYYPLDSLADGANVYGYSVAQTLVAVLKQCGDDLARENFMKQAANIP